MEEGLCIVYQLEEAAGKRNLALIICWNKQHREGTLDCLPVGGGCLEEGLCP